MMRFRWLILAGALLAAPEALYAQANNYEVPPVGFTGPLSHPRYEDGGFFVAIQGLYWRQNRPIESQVIAYRGFIDVDGSASGFALPPGTFVGSGDVALDTEQLQGPGSYQPGYHLSMGWRFESGVVVQLSWYHLFDSRYSAMATLAAPDLKGGPDLSDTFLTANVFNFPVDFAGNAFNLAVGNPGATFGIWNAASLMQIDFVQRFDMFELSGRIPMWQTDNFRCYGMIGPRIVALWERFRWRTVDADVNGLSGPGTTAVYSNTVSNRLYGVNFGGGSEWFLGDTPIGGFACSIDLGGSLYVDFVKARPRWELADRSIGASRARNMWTIAPEVEAKINLWWYPWEGISFQLGYSGMAFFNTVASPRPVDFNFASIDPEFSKGITRCLHGLTFGVGFVF